MSVAENLKEIKSQLPDDVQLVAVSKVHLVDHIIKAYEAGHLDYGENKVQEMVSKAEVMPKEIRWHLVGHLQRNKVKYIVDFVHLIHGVDSLKLLKEIDKRAAKIDRVVDCLLQVHIAEEDSKFGFDEPECAELLASETFKAMRNVRIKGLMGMATFTEDQDQVGREFASLKALFERLKSQFSAHDQWQPETLSMGMSGDYQLAIEQGSTMVRIGSAIFGERNYD
ncbi:MAG: YggS family pyridoxal phosphate-dependent enzyme [Salibacteraceae bacterium]